MESLRQKCRGLEFSAQSALKTLGKMGIWAQWTQWALFFAIFNVGRVDEFLAAMARPGTAATIGRR